MFFDGSFFKHFSSLYNGIKNSLENFIIHNIFFTLLQFFLNLTIQWFGHLLNMRFIIVSKMELSFPK